MHKVYVTSALINDDNEPIQTTHWSKATANSKHAYAAENNKVLGDVYILDLLLCKHVNCTNPDHVEAIDEINNVHIDLWWHLVQIMYVLHSHNTSQSCARV